MIERNSFLCSNTSTSLKTTLAPEMHLAEDITFTTRGDIEHRKISDIPSRNLKTNSFQNRRAEFRDTVNLSKEE
jgi:hypothetical protein